MTESFQPTEQVREFGEQALAAGRTLGAVALDTYERAVASYLELEQKTAEVVPSEWMKAAIDAHVSFVKDVNEAYLKVARSALV
jgi:hypothetical protein